MNVVCVAERQAGCGYRGGRGRGWRGWPRGTAGYYNARGTGSDYYFVSPGLCTMQSSFFTSAGHIILLKATSFQISVVRCKHHSRNLSKIHVIMTCFDGVVNNSSMGSLSV